jgi:hypothetical protein
MAKRMTPVALAALKEALRCIYWYKSDLESFIRLSVTDATVLSRLNFDGYKRAVASDLVDMLAADQDRHLDDLLELMGNVVEFDNFGHLERLDDGQAKAKEARAAVAALRVHYDRDSELRGEREAAESRRLAAQEAIAANRAVQERLGELQRAMADMLALPAQERGYKLEPLLRELFELFDLDPKGSFKVSGEQIDGAFTFDTTDYLLEARWRKEPASGDALDHFSKKVERKLENTLGPPFSSHSKNLAPGRTWSRSSSFTRRPAARSAAASEAAASATAEPSRWIGTTTT